MNLRQEIEFELRHTTNFDTIWGVGIKNALDKGNEDKIELLMYQLKSQSQDDPNTMATIIGWKCVNLLKLLH